MEQTIPPTPIPEAPGPEVPGPEVPAQGATLRVGVKGMTCASCSARVERGLGKVDGVASANVNLATEQATVVFDPGVVGTDALLAAVRDAGGDVRGTGRLADLYGGVGLFAAVAAEQVGRDGTVVSVEGNRRASQLAAENLQDLPQVSTGTADVTDWVRARRGGVDVVVLDPPRNGAGLELMDLLAAAVRQRIVYVSCEPSTLARDLAAIEKKGWGLTELRAFDLFPHTHHIESVAVLERV